MLISIDLEFGHSMLAFVCWLSVILGAALGDEEGGSISINKPIGRNRKNWPRLSAEHIRCFCNLPACVTTGYMCKSSGGGCFSESSDLRIPPVTSTTAGEYRGRHGCLELLENESERSQCQNSNEETHIVRNGRKDEQKSVVCCYHDMCNRADAPQNKNIVNSTFMGEIMEDAPPAAQHPRHPPFYRPEHQQRPQAGIRGGEPLLYTSSEVWFRAATIAVPICGAVILFALIALAVKILRGEERRDVGHKLGPAMYVHQVPRKNCHEKCIDSYESQYDNLLRKQYSPTHHQNVLYSNQSDEDFSKQYQVPLLVQNDVQSYKNNLINYCSSNNKNDTNSKLEKDPSKSIILEIEKGSPTCSENNVHQSNHDKYVKINEKFCRDV